MVFLRISVSLLAQRNAKLQAGYRCNHVYHVSAGFYGTINRYSVTVRFESNRLRLLRVLTGLQSARIQKCGWKLLKQRDSSIKLPLQRATSISKLQFRSIKQTVQSHCYTKKQFTVVVFCIRSGYISVEWSVICKIYSVLHRFVHNLKVCQRDFTRCLARHSSLTAYTRFAILY